MNFKHSAFIENSREMREWLDGLGYKPITLLVSDNDSLLITRHDKGAYMTKNGNPLFDYVDCRNDPDLFKAVTAMRDDSDYMQWFIADHAMERQDESSGKWESARWFIWNSKESMCTAGRKATLEELIEHFK